jgi:hypothetical protein
MTLAEYIIMFALVAVWAQACQAQVMRPSSRQAASPEKAS